MVQNWHIQWNETVDYFIKKKIVYRILYIMKWTETENYNWI